VNPKLQKFTPATAEKRKNREKRGMTLTYLKKKSPGGTGKICRGIKWGKKKKDRTLSGKWVCYLRVKEKTCTTNTEFRGVKGLKGVREKAGFKVIKVAAKMGVGKYPPRQSPIFNWELLQAKNEKGKTTRRQGTSLQEVRAQLRRTRRENTKMSTPVENTQPIGEGKPRKNSAKISRWSEIFFRVARGAEET